MSDDSLQYGTQKYSAQFSLTRAYGALDSRVLISTESDFLALQLPTTMAVPIDTTPAATAIAVQCTTWPGHPWSTRLDASRVPS
ncbi:hypothetical protein MY8738_007290 [Beauveria namnaoensis]